MMAKELGELILVANANGRSDGFHRQVGGKQKGACLVEMDEPQFLHRRATAEPLEFSDEGEFAHFSVAGQTVQRERVCQIFADKGKNNFNPRVARHGAKPTQLPKKGVEKRFRYFGRMLVTLIVDQPRD